MSDGGAKNGSRTHRERRSGNQPDLTRREFIRSAGLGAAGVALGSGFAQGQRGSRGPMRLGETAGETAASQPPNVLFLMVDQMRPPVWYSHRDPRLPAFDRLVREGVSFSNTMTSAVPCTPSRACIFTGLHLPQHGLESNTGPLTFGSGAPSLDPSIPTLGHYFQRAGYRTPYFGKWHLTRPEDCEGVGLSHYGFEEWMPPDPQGIPGEGAAEDVLIVDQAIDWLSANHNKGPWLLTVSLVNPHDVMYYRRCAVPRPPNVPNICDELPANWDDDLSGKPGAQKQYQKAYGALFGMLPNVPEDWWHQYIDYYYYVNALADAEMGRLLDTLDALGLSDDTLVVFVSDHGEMAGSHRLQAKGPFVYQENNQIPLIMRWPGRFQARGETAALTQTVDLLPTLLEIAGIEPISDYLPGRSMVPVINPPRLAEVNEYVLMAYGMSLNMVMEDMASTAGLPVPEIEPPLAPGKIRAIFDGRYKYARYFEEGLDEEEYELYDLENDPLEMVNLHGDLGYRRVERRMSDALRDAEASDMAAIDPASYQM
ncbi:MAG: sulfatase-like hydrolase/transferase [Phycisphaerae bacterium]|nr:sulfatase-like hydrolase/transferase [Phycisphaerae bacterium]